MSRIQKTFSTLKQAGRKGLIPFITAGDPSPQATVPLMHALVAGGADIIELGIPFSDPMADGPTIQRASERALAQGMSLAKVLEAVRTFRQTNANTPVVLMGYANPIEAMGIDAFAKRAAQAGVDGALVVDYPPQACRPFTQALRQAGLDQIFLLAPTSEPARYKEVAEAGSGYIYYVSLKGVTGSAQIDIAQVAARIPDIQKQVGMPVGVGFGIRDAISAKQVAQVADAVVIGSRIIEEIETSNNANAPARVEAFMANIRRALDEIEGEPA